MRLTQSEIETLYEIIVNQGYDVGMLFTPSDIYPDNDNKSLGGRRNIFRLRYKGVLEVVSWPPGTVSWSLTEEGVEAFQASQSTPQKSTYLGD